MPEFIVAVKKGLTEKQYKEAQQHAVDKGGKIVSEFDRDGIMPGFVVDFPADSVSTLESGPHVESVESNGEVKTQ
ncbi:related to proteinase inhibitor PBI2 [Rhynchosporium agropyri]|uniref:Related to proteinase inhibitor PBI2 n=1 Tax=Rhynchosporium agropyri TaxID=914238 RepID=A0A1E1JRA6_9HELO|nr:related to proteinase inhibitor PBI2 [Rhynchosporium agropyri]